MTSLLNDKRRAIKLLVENILCGNVIINQKIAIESQSGDDYSNLLNSLIDWNESYPNDVIKDEQKPTQIDVIFELFLGGRIEGWITGILEERAGFKWLVNQDEEIMT